MASGPERKLLVEGFSREVTEPALESLYESAAQTSDTGIESESHDYSAINKGGTTEVDERVFWSLTRD